MSSILQPGVSVTQEFSASTTTIASPNLIPVIVGPCYHVVDSVLSNNTFNSSAEAGTYKSQIGTQAFSFPGLSSYSGAILDTSSVKVYLDTLNGTPMAALRSEDDESVLFSGTGGLLSGAGSDPIFTDASVSDWSGYGITARTSTSKGDVVRFTYKGRTYDLEVTDLLDSSDVSVSSSGNPATKLKLDVSHLTVDNDVSSDTDSPLYGVTISSMTYNVIDKPANYVVKTAPLNARTHQLVDPTGSNFAAFEATGSMAGAAAEAASLSVVLTSAQMERGTETGYGDGALFVSGSIISSVVVGDFLAFDTGGTITLHEVAAVIGTKALGLTAGGLNGLGSAKDWLAGEKVTNTQTGTTNGGGLFNQTINTGNAATHSGSCVVKVNGVAALQLASLDGAGALTFSNYGSQSPTLEYIVLGEDSGSADGAEGADKFASAGLSATTTVGAYLELSGSYLATSGSVADNMITVTGITSQAGVTWTTVPATETATAQYSATTQTITINIERALGVPSTLADLQAMLTTDDASELDPTVSPLVTVTLEGGALSGKIAEAAFCPPGTSDIGSRTYPFEGGYDANQVLLDGGMIGGSPVKVYVSYRALRVDLSAAAADPTLITIDSLEDISAKIGRSDTTSNPLGLAAKLALTNTVGNTSIKVLGLSAADSSELASYPEGSSTAYSEALTLLEAEDVYALAPLSDSREIATLFNSHVNTMSLPANKSERICFVSRELPEYSQAQLIASGSSGVTSATFQSDGLFTTGVDFGEGGANFSKLKAALDAAKDVILVLNSFKTTSEGAQLLQGAASEQYGFRVSAVNSSNSYILEANVSDIKTANPNDQSSQSWYLYVQGEAITASADQATRIATFGGEYSNRRTLLVWPSKVVATVGTNSEFLPGYYVSSVIAASVGFQGVSQGFTNLSLSGFTGIRYSNRHFSRSQLDQIAGGGTMIVMQDTDSGPLKIRHQLSTDVTTVQRRELSITKSVDFFAKTLRDSLIDRIGGFNITTEFIEGLGMNIQAIIARMVQTNVIASATLTSIEQDSSNPDTIDINIRVTPLYPCNYIDITLQL